MADETVTNDACSFDEIHTENLGYCPNNDTVGGVRLTVKYIPMAQADVTLPTVTNESKYGERITLPATGIKPKTGKGFKKIIILVDEGELKPSLVGAKGNKKMKVDFTCLIPNFVKENVGFMDAHRNTPLLLVIEDSTGQPWAILDAFFSEATGTTAKTYEENSGWTVTLSANSKLYAYDGEIAVLPDAETP